MPNTARDRSYIAWLFIVLVLVSSLSYFFDFTSIVSTVTHHPYFNLMKNYGVPALFIGLFLIWRRSLLSSALSHAGIAVAVGGLTWYVLQYKNLIPDLRFWSIIFGIIAGLMTWTILRGVWEHPPSFKLTGQFSPMVWPGLVLVVGCIYYLSRWLMPPYPGLLLALSVIWFFILPGVLAARLYQAHCDVPVPGIQLFNVALTIATVAGAIVLLLTNLVTIPLSTTVVQLVFFSVNVCLAGGIWLRQHHRSAAAS